ncbi:MAG: pilus assembly protein TadG-related protein [Actinomycetota bacterium]
MLRSTRSHRSRQSDDRGLAIPLVALSLVILMVFAAFVLDLGLVYTERRNDQNSVDAAATSGAVQLLRVQSAQAAVDEIVAKVNDDLERTVSNSEWTACSDPANLTRTAVTLALTPATDCISFSAGFDRVRVRIPNQTINTTFGRVVGLNSFTSSAFAEVSTTPAGGGALPFVVTSLNGPGDQICLRTDGTGGDEPPDQPPPPDDPYGQGFQLDPCNEQSFDTHEGGRGTIKPYFYVGCNRPTGNQSIVDAIMVGMDHQIGVFDPEVTLAPGASANLLDSNPGARIDGGGGCTVALPNTVDIDTGLTAQLLRCSLLEVPCASGSSATSGQSGRLSGPIATAEFAELGVNDTALWDYFVGSLPSGSPASCTVAKSNLTEFYLRRAALRDCLTNWTSGQLFTDDIADQKRLGFVPRIAERGLCDTQPNPPSDPDCQGNGPLSNVHVNNFSPVYIDGLYQDNAGICDLTNPATPLLSTTWAIHYPGKGMKCGDSSGSDVIHRVSGIVVPCGALPGTVCDPTSNPPFPDPIGLARIRLVK